jgi:hypothetical protein
LKVSHLAQVTPLILLTLITAALCPAQSAPQPANSGANQSAQSPTAGAGQPAPSADQTQGQNQGKAAQGSKDANETAGTSKDRLFFALPNFLTVDKNGRIIPLTAGQKFKVVAQSSFDPIQIVWYGALAGVSQAQDSEPGFGQGAKGYAKRFGAYAADGTIENFLTSAILPSMLHQDPRYFPKSQGGFFNRASYAATRIVVTRGDSGHSQFNFSEIFGSAMASAISTYSYHPGRTLKGFDNDGTPIYYTSDRTLKNAASVWGSQVAYDTITQVIKEFWPDIRRKIKTQPH